VLGINDKNCKWWVLGSVSGVLGLIVLDETVVGVALPTMRDDLGMSLLSSHWVMNAYLLVFTGFVAVGGKLDDIVGLRNLFIAGIALFGLASLASGIAQNGTWIIAARALQGLGAAMVFPASFAMISTVFAPEQRGVAFGIQTTVGATFLSLGPLIGGALTEFLSWRWIFWINLPVVAGIIFFTLASWQEPARQDSTPRIDYLGLVTLVAGLGALVLAIMQGPEWGWSDPLTLALLAAGVLILAVFAVTELKIVEPLIELDLFRNPTFTGSNLVVFTGELNKIAVIIFGALYLQKALGMSPFEAGLALLAAVVPTLLTCILAGRLADRFGTRWPALTGVLIFAVGITWIGLAAPFNDYHLLLPALVIWGAGMPFLYVPTTRAVMNSVPASKRGQASGIRVTAQFLGGTMGMALSGTLYAITRDFQVVFLATGVFTFLVLLISWFSIEHPALGGPMTQAAHGHPEHL